MECSGCGFDSICWADRVLSVSLLAGSILGMKALSRGGKYWLSPWNGYLFAQFFCLGIAYLKLVPTMTDFRLNTWLAVVLSACGFFLGCGLSAKASSTRGTIQASHEFQEQVIAKLFKGLLPVLMVFFLVGVWMALKSAGGWPIFMPDPEKARRLFAWPGFVGVMFFQTLYCLALAGMVVRKFEKAMIWRLFGLVAIVLPILAGVFSGMRFYSLLIGLSWVLFEDISKPIKLGKLLGIVLVMLFVLTWVFLVRIGLSGVQAISIGLGNLEYAENVYLPLYSYVANNFWNLDWMFYLDTKFRSIETTLGYTSFWGFLYPTYATFSIDDAFGLNDKFAMVLKTSSLNTISYQGFLYVDFGWIGLFIVPFFVGFISTWAYLRAKKTKGVFESLLHSIFGFGVFFCFFAWAPRQPSFAFGVMMVVVVAGIAKGIAAVYAVRNGDDKPVASAR